MGRGLEGGGYWTERAAAGASMRAAGRAIRRSCPGALEGLRSLRRGSGRVRQANQGRMADLSLRFKFKI